jgi:hypothetical protein
MIDGDPPEAQSEFWTSVDLKLILSTKEMRTQRHQAGTPLGWTHGRCEVDHTLVGGVSNGSSLVHYWTRTSGEVGSLEVNSVPRQDLRLVMKPGVYGRHAQPLKLGTHIGREAVVIRPTVVSVGGLYPALGSKSLVSVRTRFDDLHWCDRSPEVDELLLMWDVPKIVSKGLSPEDKVILEVLVKVPMRVRRAVCISLS